MQREKGPETHDLINLISRFDQADELFDLADCLREEEISESQFRRLEALLKEHWAARKLYCEYMAMLDLIPSV